MEDGEWLKRQQEEPNNRKGEEFLEMLQTILKDRLSQRDLLRATLRFDKQTHHAPHAPTTPLPTRLLNTLHSEIILVHLRLSERNPWSSLIDSILLYIL